MSVWDELEGFFAYDQGATDSGVKDDVRRAEVARLVDGMPDAYVRRELALWIRDGYLSDTGLREGYGPEDARAFLDWFYDGDYRV